MNRFVNIVRKFKKVNIVEVGARDGLQSEKPISISNRIHFINNLSDCGFKQIEVGSLVKLESMQNSDEVFKNIKKLKNTEYPLLILNKYGIEKAIDLDVKHISIVISPSDTFCKKNMGKSLDDLKLQIKDIMTIANKNNMIVRGYISTIANCPYEGLMSSKSVSNLTQYLIDLGCYEISLGDTTGEASQQQIEDIIIDIKNKNIPTSKLAGHYHDTYNKAINNVIISMNHGIKTFDTSIAGLGGCPFAPGASGNLATQKLIRFLELNEIRTDLDNSKINFTSDLICKILNREKYPIIIE